MLVCSTDCSPHNQLLWQQLMSHHTLCGDSKGKDFWSKNLQDMKRTSCHTEVFLLKLKGMAFYWLRGKPQLVPHPKEPHLNPICSKGGIVFRIYVQQCISSESSSPLYCTACMDSAGLKDSRKQMHPSGHINQSLKSEDTPTDGKEWLIDLWCVNFYLTLKSD